MIQIFVSVFLVVIFAVGPLRAQTSPAVSHQKSCGEPEQGYGRLQKPPVITGKPYTVPELRLEITDDQTGRPIAEHDVIVRYMWRWFEYPYPDRLFGVWDDAYDVVKCTSNKDGSVLVPEFKVTPLGWYKGKMLLGRKPEFTHLEVSINRETQTTTFEITKKHLERYVNSGTNRIPLRVSVTK